MVAEQMDSTIVYLIGHYGVGKLTVAKALCTLTGARLLDNHLINNVVFSLIRADGRTPLPERVWDHIADIRTIAFEVMETLAPVEFSYVLTNALDDVPADRVWYDRAVSLAERRGARFVPVIVTCDEAENARRIPSADRAANMKHIDAVSAMERRRSVPQLPVVHPNRLDLDTTRQSPEASAAAILGHVRSRA
jgi:predicted kinase